MTKLSSSENNFQNFLPKASLEETELFSKIINTIGDELLIIDDDAWIIFANDAAIRALGFSREYILKKRVLDFFKQKISLKEWKTTQLAQLKRAKKPISYRVERHVKGGKTQAIDVTAVYMTYKSRGCILSIAREITQQLVLQRSLEETVDQYYALCDGAGDPILTVSLDGKITYANFAAEKLFKISVRRLKTKHLKDAIHPDSMARIWKYFLRVRKSKTPARLEVNAVNKYHGIIPVEVTVSPLMEKGEISAFHTIVRDIRQRKKLEFLVKESEKKDAVQYFVSGTAQELNHPLLAINNQIDALLGKYKNRDYEFIGYKEFKHIMTTLEKISGQVKYSCDTIHRLISLNKKKAGIRKNYCSANDVIQGIVRTKTNVLKLNKIKCKLKLASNLPFVAMWKSEFNQVITNVINNAIDAMPGDGTLSIRTYLSTGEKEVGIEIKDEGVGISKGDLPHIFDPFFTTKQRGIGKNSGLGLLIVYSLLHACQGEIDIKSSLSKGTSVRISLPVKRNGHK